MEEELRDRIAAAISEGGCNPHMAARRVIRALEPELTAAIRARLYELDAERAGAPDNDWRGAKARSQERRRLFKQLNPSERNHMTRVPDRIRVLVRTRDRGCCIVCGVDVTDRPSSMHHRRPRGQGGTRRPDTPANLVLVCGSGTTGCHGWLESRRQDAYDLGLLVHQWEDPARVPVAISRVGPTYLTHDGLYTLRPGEETA